MLDSKGKLQSGVKTTGTLGAIAAGYFAVRPATRMHLAAITASVAAAAPIISAVFEAWQYDISQSPSGASRELNRTSYGFQSGEWETWDAYKSALIDTAVSQANTDRAIEYLENSGRVRILDPYRQTMLALQKECNAYATPRSRLDVIPLEIERERWDQKLRHYTGVPHVADESILMHKDSTLWRNAIRLSLIGTRDLPSPPLPRRYHVLDELLQTSTSEAAWFCVGAAIGLVHGAADYLWNAIAA